MYLYSNIKQKKAYEAFKKDLTKDLTSTEPDSLEAQATTAELNMINDDLDHINHNIQVLLQ